MTNTTPPSPTSPAPFGDDDPRMLFALAVAQGTPVIDQVRPDQMTLPTPCTEMDVRSLLGHLVMVVQRVACAGRGDDPWTWPEDVTGLADDAWSTAWLDAAHDVQATWADDALLERSMTLPWATMPGRDVLAIYTNEVTVHTWDLARATGQNPEWNPRVLTAALDAIRAQLPDADRAPTWDAVKAEMPPGFAWEDPFAHAVAIADDAPLIDRLVAWNGRAPHA